MQIFESKEVTKKYVLLLHAKTDFKTIFAKIYFFKKVRKNDWRTISAINLKFGFNLNKVSYVCEVFVVTIFINLKYTEVPEMIISHLT